MYIIEQFTFTNSVLIWKNGQLACYCRILNPIKIGEKFKIQRSRRQIRKILGTVRLQKLQRKSAILVNKTGKSLLKWIYIEIKRKIAHPSCGFE